MVISLEQGADLHTAQLMPLPLTVSCFSKIQIGFTFLVAAYPGSSGQRAIKRARARARARARVCVCVCVCVLNTTKLFTVCKIANIVKLSTDRWLFIH